MASKNLGLSGNIANIIPLNRLMSEIQTKYKRHGLKFKLEICHVKSIGMIIIANVDIGIKRALRKMDEHAIARGAVLDV